MDLANIGWNDDFAASFSRHAAAGWVPGRVAAESREIYQVWCAAGELTAELAGRLRYGAEERLQLPAVGDWVALQTFPGAGTAVVQAVLPRQSLLVRKAAGTRTEGQLLGANVDFVWLVTSLNHDLNLRRLERYLALVLDGGAVPVVVLSKADLVGDAAAALAAVAAIARGVPVHAVSAVEGAGLEELAVYLRRGRTVALLGSSGAGKSTLINRLLGAEQQAVREVRAGDDRGRHTTTRRQLLPLPGGALVMDTPGLRELALWGEGDAGGVFAEVEALASECRFHDCRHRGEPGCAVQRAVAAGQLAAARLEGYHKLQREAAYLETRLEGNAALAEKRKWRAVMGKQTKAGRRRDELLRGRPR